MLKLWIVLAKLMERFFRYHLKGSFLYEFAIRNVILPSLVIASAAKQSRFGGQRDCFPAERGISLLAMTADIDVMKIMANRYQSITATKLSIPRHSCYSQGSWNEALPLELDNSDPKIRIL
jgi:hypothetical protein